MGFKKNQSGNPGGRPKGLAAFVRELTSDNQEQAKFMHRVAHSLDLRPPKGGRVDATLDQVMEAHKWLADRGSGKAVNRVSIHEEEVDPLEGFSSEQLRELALREIDEEAVEDAPPAQH